MKNDKYPINDNKSNLILLLPVLFVATMNLNRFFTSINSALHVLTLLIVINISYIFFNITLRDIKLGVYPAAILFTICLIFYITIGTFKSNPIDNLGIALGIIQNISIVLLMLFTLNRMSDYEKVLSTIHYSGIILGVLGILEFLNIFFIMGLVGEPMLYYGNRIGTTWINPNAYALALVFCFICSMEAKRNTKALLGRIIMIIGIMVSMSRSAVLIIGIILFLNTILKNRIKVKRKNILKMILFGFLIIVLMIQIVNMDPVKKIIDNSRITRIFTFKDSNSDDISNGRIDALLNSMDIIKENLLSGIGIKNIPGYGDITQSAHNIYFNIWAESGIIPFLLYMSFMYSLFVIIKRRSKKFKYDRLVRNLFIMLIAYGFFSHTLLTNPITGILSSLIILKDKFS